MEMLKTMRSTRFWLVGSSATASGFFFFEFLPFSSLLYYVVRSS